MWKRCNATIQFCRVELRRGTYSLQDTQNLDADDTHYVTNHNVMLFELNDKFQFMPDIILLLILKTSTMRVMLVSPHIIPPPQRANLFFIF